MWQQQHPQNPFMTLIFCAYMCMYCMCRIMCMYVYPYRFSHADVTVFSRRLKSRLFVPPIRLPVLRVGRTYGTHLHYERTYTTNVPIL